MPLAVGVFLLPEREGVLVQLVVAEGAGAVPAPQDFIAGFALVILNSEKPLPGGVQVVELIGLQIAEIEKIVFGVQNGLGDFSIGGLGPARGGERAGRAPQTEFL